MSWKLVLLAALVCGVTALALSQFLGGHNGKTVSEREVRVVLTRGSSTSNEVGRTGSGTEASGSPEAEAAVTNVRRVRNGDAEATSPDTAPSAGRDRPLEGLTVSVDPGHNGGNFTHPEEINRMVPAGAGEVMKACNTTGTETDDGSLTETQFNWDVAQVLVSRLEHLGATVVLTRHSNDGVGPCVDERAEIANQAHAAVALSIHADGNLAEGAHGFDVIHPSPDEMVAPAMVGPSFELAEQVRDALAAAGVPPANYVGRDGLDERSDLAGLNLARVPAALVELGNMREAEEAAKLEDPTYRHRLAAALAVGIVSFLRRR
jgi:N-acetylmuramoyl-L-alanine amidase